MRILRLVSDGEYALEFHPYVTVVTGLSDGQRSDVLDAFRQAVAGRPSKLTGLLEVHGVVLDMDERSFQLLDLGDAAVDLVVDADALPGAATTAMGRRLESAERRLELIEIPHRERLDEVRLAEVAADEAAEALVLARARAEQAESTPDDSIDEELEALEAELARVEHELEQLAEPGSRAAGELQRAEREAEEASAAVAALAPDLDAGALERRRTDLTEQLDPEATEALEAALAQMLETQSALERALADLDDVLASAEDDEESRREEEEEEEEGDEDGDEGGEPSDDADRIDQLRGIVALQESFDPAPVRSALDAIRLNPSAGDLVPSPEALSLADRLEQLGRRIDDLERRVEDPPEPRAIEAARARLDEVRAALLTQERASSSSERVDDDIAELERAHAAVVEASEALESRFGRAKAEARLAEARAAEDAVLERLGIRSYTEFMSGGRASMHAAAEPDELKELRAAERDAEWTLRGLEHQVELALELAEVVEDRRQIRAQARRLLGTPDLTDGGLVHALLDLRVPAGQDSPASALVDALEGVGLPVRALDFSVDELEVMAAEWLDEYFRAEERRAKLEHELAELEAGRSKVVVEDVIIPEPEAVPGGRATAMPPAAIGPEPEAETAPEPEAETEPEPDVAEPETEPEPDVEVEPEVAAAEPEPEAETAPEPDVAEPEVEVEPEEAEPEPEPASAEGPDSGAPASTERSDDRRVAADAQRAALVAAEAAVEAASDDHAVVQELVRAAKARLIAHEQARAALAELDAETSAANRAAADAEVIRHRAASAETAAVAAREEHDRLESQRVDLEQEVMRIRSELEQRKRSVDHAAEQLTQAVADAEAALAAADSRLQSARTEFDEARSDYDAAVEEVASLRNTVAEVADEPAPVEEIEWYLLARLAGQRHVSFAGSVPLVVDRALDGLDDEGLVHLLDRLERMAGAVQVVHLSDDEGIIEWAAAAGEDRVAVVGPLAALQPRSDSA